MKPKLAGKLLIEMARDLPVVIEKKNALSTFYNFLYDPQIFSGSYLMV